MRTRTEGKSVGTLHEGRKPTHEGWQWEHLMDEDQDRRKGSGNAALRKKTSLRGMAVGAPHG